MSEGVVRFARVTDVDVAGPGGTELLGPAELARLARLRHPEDRAAYRAAHVLVRRCAAALLDVDVADLVLHQECPGCGGTGHGRPVLAGLPGVGLALSHSRAHVAAAAAHGRCGVDVEDLPGERVPDRVLAPAERDWLDRGAGAEDPGAGLRLWVRKEALVKAGAAELADAVTLDLMDTAVDAADAGGRLREHAHGLALGEWRTADAVGAWAVPPGTRVSRG
ncbi:4'-phosphopantetheinyl transferase superfamily protein [Nocardioides sp. dk4132]|uniref:4'-phosphopantetheinyl transferase family protein n=1 Tax=unclassified Nocardioides TaxID=2615069 RepID=UPI0012968407|nr:MULTISPECIES: 4'-phosphopantetheinyl transferase superfamily protein [unclassified Nocardioides]MQW75277.1 4'-phosphopantetheinyl transferase superfamily protein [Nocardioides sp. dk4132]QGA07572.1 4'-phosphopantetheinyl transferase superfamily protein [Nocardioides sp. dk884]